VPSAAKLSTEKTVSTVSDSKVSTCGWWSMSLMDRIATPKTSARTTLAM
jgi:hypothetical protein